MAENEINKVQVLIRRFLFEVDGIIHDPSACQAWLQSFCKTLQFQDLCKEPNQYALFLLDEARAFNIEQRRKSQMKQVRRALAEDGIKNPTEEQLAERWMLMYGQENSPQDAPNGNAGVDMSDAGNGAASKSPTSCDTFTADGDIREDSLARPDGSAITRNETRASDALEPSANHYGPRQAKNGDAATREGAEVVDSRESGAADPTTVSRNMRRVPQNEAPAHGFSGGRTAQGTMSRSPEAAAQSGKDSAKTRDTRDDSRGRYAPPSCSPEDGNPAETAPSHGGSVASLEARESRRAGGNSVRRVAKVSTPPARPGRISRCPNSREDFHAFVADNKLHEGLAEEWYAIHEARGWVDKNGNPIKDWRGALYNYCIKTEQKRRTA